MSSDKVVSNENAIDASYIMGALSSLIENYDLIKYTNFVLIKKFKKTKNGFLYLYYFQ